MCVVFAGGQLSRRLRWCILTLRSFLSTAVCWCKATMAHRRNRMFVRPCTEGLWLENTTVFLEKGCLMLQAWPLWWAEVGAAHTGGGSSLCLGGHCHSWKCPSPRHSTKQSQGQSWATAQVPPSFSCRHLWCCGVCSIPRILFKITSLLSQWEALECMIQNCGRPVPSTCLWSWGGYMHSTTEICQPESLNYSGVSYPGKSLHSFYGKLIKIHISQI